MRQIGRYQIRNELGRGGMAVVYRAHDPRFEREVAIKLLPAQFTHDPEFIGRFQNEAKIIAALEHPAIVPVYDFGAHEDAPYLVMRFMAGGSLEERLKGSPLPLSEISRNYDRLAPALDKAHQRGIIHRDLKPANVFFDEDNNAFLGDFGIARVAEATQTMTIIGTPAYMAPEQAQGNEKLDWRCDIYALGVMFFELATGKKPYVAESATGQMLMHVLQPVPDILIANPKLPPEAQNIINKSMAKERAFRYPTASALAEDISGLLQQPAAGGIAAAGLGMAAAPVVESPLQATQETVVESASYAQQPATAPQQLATAAQQPATAAQQPAAPPSQSKGKSGRGWLIAVLAVILLIAGLGAGYYFVFGGGSESDQVAASSAPQPENAPVVAPDPSPTVGPAVEEEQADAPGAGTSETAAETDAETDTETAAATDTETAAETDTETPAETDAQTAETQALDTDGDKLIDAEDDCPQQPGPVDAGGCPQTEVSAPAENANTAEIFDFDLPPQISALLSDPDVIFHDDFAQISPTYWREAAAYTSANGLLELADTDECLARLAGMPANSAVLVHFAYDDIPYSDFEMFINNDTLGSVNYRQWGTRINTDNPTIQVLRKRAIIDDSALEGELSLDPGTWYQLLLAVDQDAEFVAHLWESDDPSTYAEYRSTLDDWADQEWFGVFCNARGNVLVDNYTEIAFSGILPPLVAAAPEPTTASTNQTGAASQGSGVPMGFETFGTWRRGNQDNGTFTQSSEQAHSGGSSAKLAYDFPSADNDYVVFMQLNDISGSPDTLSAWVYGDGVGHYLNVWIVDNDGQTWQVPLGNVTHTGWKKMSGRIDMDQDWPWTHISGPKNGKVDYPITFRAFVLDDYSASYEGKGEIFIDDLSATTLGGANTGGTGPANTPVATAAAGATPSPAATTAASTGPLDFSYVVEWKLDPEDDSNAIATVNIYPSGGDGNYSYYQDENLKSGSKWTFKWRACKNYPGSFRVDSGDGQSVKKDIWERAACPDD